ncbi:MAG: DUF4474 domain-containing protein [Eubacterium sp.]
MKKCEKCYILDELVKPFGYCYNCNYEFFSSTIDAWQREAGYTYIYDYMAPHFQMVFDYEPIYFNYNGKTWLIEFWKGQYGINTGTEIGIYHADKIILPNNYKSTLFNCADNEEMLPCSILLYGKYGSYVYVSKRHWWLTAFLTGCFSNPSDLCMEISITFPNTEMLSAFIEGMYMAGYTSRDFQVCELRLFFTFRKAQNKDNSLSIRFWCRFSQCKNKIFCKLYLFFTKPFSATEDRILYLYYYLPFAFRKVLRMHRFNKHCMREHI